MKFILPIFFLLLNCSSIFSQVSFLDSTYIWTEWYQHFEDYTVRYKLDSEPVVYNTKLYYEILLSHTQSGNDWIHTDKYISTVPPRIYWVDNFEEKVLYDFSLEPGDDFVYPFGWQDTQHVVAVDSITLRNGEKRKLLKLTCEIPYDTSYWVEGLMSLRGLFLENICEPTLTNNPLVMCIHRYDTLLYRLPYVDSCFITVDKPVPFMDSKYVWTEYYVTGFGQYQSTTRYTFSSEPTNINGIDYYERLSSYEPSGPNWVSTGMFYRSDGTGKIYLSYLNNENLIYDYSLGVNDTFQLLIVDHIDSIQLENGEKRKRLTLRCSDDEDPPTGFGYSHWIEGLGGEEGVYDSYGFDECAFDADGHEMLCILRNDSLIFDNPNADSCWYVTVSTNDPWEKSISIFPNPTSGKINIVSEKPELQIRVYDPLGQCLEISNDRDIDLSDFLPGLYYIQFYSPDRKLIFRRILKL
ncbi:MAG: T9SS type A sorting domain-containing protein [Saprospiraceae bacterium]